MVRPEFVMKSQTKINHTYAHNNHINEIFSIQGYRYQFITVDYRTRKELIDDFDFAHTAISYDMAKDTLYMNEKTYHCIKNKILMKHTESSVIKQHRLEKFRNEGWDDSQL